MGGKVLSDSYRDIETSSYTVKKLPWKSYAENITRVYFDKTIAPINTKYWFNNFSKLKSIENIELLDTSNVTDMKQMFYGCSALTSIDLRSFDTSNVTMMSSMFAACTGLTNIDLAKFDTGNVLSFSGMFSGCRALANIDLSNFDTSKAVLLGSMFNGCEMLTTIDLSSFDTSKVTETLYMFNGCSNLETIYASSLWTQAKMSYGKSLNMFEGCTKLVGGSGTVYNTSYIEYLYARIDGGTDNPGYFTEKTA